MSKDYTSKPLLFQKSDPSSWPKGTLVRRRWLNGGIKEPYIHRTGVVYGAIGKHLRIEWDAGVIAWCSPYGLVTLSPEEIVINEDF